MELKNIVFIIVLRLVLFNIAKGSKNVPLHSSDATFSNVDVKLSGDVLIKTGNASEDPLLILVGKTIVGLENKIKKLSRKCKKLAKAAAVSKKEIIERLSKMEHVIEDCIRNFTEEISDERLYERPLPETCSLKLCTDWTEWSECSAGKTKVSGTRTRARSCRENSNICSLHYTAKMETESKVCKGKRCKPDYKLTRNGFCLRISTERLVIWNWAQMQCNNDGGILVNIDSELKAADVNETLHDMPVTTTLWVDGIRVLPDEKWIYENNFEESDFSLWYPEEPESHDDCKAYVLHRDLWSWRGRRCISNFFYMCEIV